MSEGSAVILHVARPREQFALATLFADCYHCDAVTATDFYVWLYSKGELAARQ
jgi:hypothetical protein